MSEQESGWIISSNFMRISLAQSLANPMFLFHNIVFNTAIHSQLRASSNAGGRDLVNSSILSELFFPWPSFEEQDRINNVVAMTMDKPISVTKAQLENYLTIKTGLMHDLLTGKVRVTDTKNPTLTPESL